jgi:hypothetical protein
MEFAEISVLLLRGAQLILRSSILTILDLNKLDATLALCNAGETSTEVGKRTAQLLQSLGSK